jgi:hypothetical protein
MALDLDMRRQLAEANQYLEDGSINPDIQATISTAAKHVQAKDMLAQLRSWTLLGQLEDDQLRLTELLACISEVAEKQNDTPTAEGAIDWYFKLSFPKDQV